MIHNFPHPKIHVSPINGGFNGKIIYKWAILTIFPKKIHGFRPGPTISSAARNAIRSGLVAAGSGGTGGADPRRPGELRWGWIPVPKFTRFLGEHGHFLVNLCDFLVNFWYL